MKKRILVSILALALGMALPLPLAMPVGAATPTFTGNVTADFTGAGVLIITDPVGDVGMPSGVPPGTISGWDMSDLRLTYNVATDTLYVGINTYGIAGDADGDGDPGGTSAWLAGRGGTDRPDLSGTERVCVFFDLDRNGTFDVIAGVPGGVDVTGFTVATFSGDQYNPLFGTNLASNKGTYYANPSPAAPDFEFTILNFSTLPGQDSFLGAFRVYAFMGSAEDDGIGEDYVDYQQDPHTAATMISSAATVASGGYISLNVTEANPTGPHSMPITSPQVALTQNGSPLATLNKASAYYTSGDTNGNGILNPGETWKWNNIPSGSITGTTTFVARGSGTAPGDFPVNYLTDPLEQVEVTVNTLTVGWETYAIDKVRVLLPWIALLAAIMVGAGLLVLRHRRAQN